MASRKKSKKPRRPRTDAPVTPAAPRPAEAPKGKKLPGEDRPPPIWGNIPVTQAAVLGGIILLVMGMVQSNPVPAFAGLALGSIGGLELSIREHFTGYRSHTTLLAGTVFIVVVALTFFLAKLVLWVCLLIGLAFALPAGWLILQAFKRKSGGLNYRVR